MHPVRIAHHFGRLAMRRLFPTPQEAAWRQLVDYSERCSGVATHRMLLENCDLEFPDPTGLAVQWYDIFVKQAMAISFATPAPRVLDCGAHVGLVSLWIKSRWPAARVTAFEADPIIASMLRRNLSRNRADDVEVVDAAIWNHTGTVTFRASGTDAGAVDSVAADSAGPLREVRAVRLRDWLTEPIDLLKLDIEGAELDVLQDSVDVLSSVRNVHLEIHDFDPSRRLLPRCLMLLEDAGFQYALSNFGSAVWRPTVRHVGPFATAVPAWVICVRAWRA
jgi:FkbM family methyltransferase